MDTQWNKEGDRIVLQEDAGDGWQTGGEKSYVPSTPITSVLLDS